CKKIEVKFSVPGRGLALRVLGSSKEAKESNHSALWDILQNTNFFRAFTASASVPAIYIQQFWNTLAYEAKTGVYSFQLDETRFTLDANLLREALEITPIDQAHHRGTCPSGKSTKLNWFCKRIGKKKLSKTDLEGPAFKVVRLFHDNNISLQFQMEECHLLLTDQVDLVNPEGYRVVPDVSKPLPLGGPPGQLKAAQYLDFVLEEQGTDTM
ncbi:hypothetical protein Tco_0537084, partial [Tanacetum coccineum]